MASAAGLFLVLLGEELDRREHRDRENGRRQDEKAEPAARIVGPPARNDEGRGESEGDEDDRRPRQADHVPRREPYEHGRDYNHASTDGCS